jgi:hypothetical protein
MCATLGEEGTIDLLDFAAELTIYTSSATLIGRPFRESLTREFSRRYFELEVGTDAIGYLHSGARIEAFRVRDRARERLVELVSEVIRERQALADPPRDLLGILLALKDGETPRYSPSVITGILISTMFAGHHTSAGTAAWLLVELLREPAILARVVAETRRALCRRPRRQLPGAARDPAARERGEGDAAAAPAADLAAAHGARRLRVRGLDRAEGHDRRDVERALARGRRLLRRAAALRPGPLRRSRAKRTRSTRGPTCRSAAAATAASARTSR